MGGGHSGGQAAPALIQVTLTVINCQFIAVNVTRITTHEAAH